MIFKSVLALAALVVSVAAHARVTSPSPRAPGTTASSACGAAVYKVLNDDLTAPIQNAVAKIDSSYNATTCPLFKCRGLSYADNKSLVQAYTVGQVVNFKVTIVAHHTGYANVSVIDLATNTALARLYTWSVYADSTIPPSAWPADEKDFNVTIPALSGKCATAGACAIQWFWYATENSQTYESCVDFTSSS
ncbi:hypothetical protein BKA62DRAFT_771492 [Auriculariales sp. MPI-PUGE-AT-0066]|nr:hypothetical protein BKA62DRAFT_771492 [Auriculariales sp. MPI-PUGE-AT-0066]